MPMCEAFQPNIQSSPSPQNLSIAEVRPEHEIGIAEITSQRDGLPIADSLARSRREMLDSTKSKDFRLFVASLDGFVVGYARFILVREDMASITKYPSPAGWYGLGLNVRERHRRQGIARALSEFRCKWLQ